MPPYMWQNQDIARVDDLAKGMKTRKLLVPGGSPGRPKADKNYKKFTLRKNGSCYIQFKVCDNYVY